MGGIAVTDHASQVQRLAERFEKDRLAWFQHLHENPEIALEEVQTTAFIREKLEGMGIEILELGLETGVVGLLRGAGEGPCIGLRADIDALRVKEQSNCPFQSKIEGKMHACGHDTHTTALLGAAQILSQMRDQINGSVKFLFQPAEEINVGAKKFIAAGALENPRVDALFGAHNQPLLPTGSVAVIDGPIMAGVTRIDIRIKGRGGHGGIPQGNIDPVVCAAAVIQGAQTIVSRNVSPVDSAVVSICHLLAGSTDANNVIPDEVTMAGTVRFYRPETEALIETRLRELVETIAKAYGCTGELTFFHMIDTTLNSHALAPIAASAVEAAGAKSIGVEPSTGGEDFSDYLPHVPGFFYWFGSRNEEKGCRWAWHNPHFRADEDSISVAARLYANTVFEAIEALKK